MMDHSQEDWAQGQAQEPQQATERPRIRLSAYVSEQLPPPGLVCRKCGCREFFVVYTRKAPGGIRRSRQCRHCGRRVITTER
jgi:hypothetical protein